MPSPPEFEIRSPHRTEALAVAARWIWLDHHDFYGIFFQDEADAIRGIEELLGQPGSDLGSRLVAAHGNELLGVMCYFPLAELPGRSLQSLRFLMSKTDDPAKAQQAGRDFAKQVPPLTGAGLYLSRITVAGSCQGMGVGSGLIRQLEELGRAGRQGRICLHVRSSNLPALRFYEKHGYSPCTEKGRQYLGLQKQLDK